MFSIGGPVNEVSLSLRWSIKPIRNRSSKGNYTKTQEDTNQMDSKFSINHSSYA